MGGYATRPGAEFESPTGEVAGPSAPQDAGDTITTTTQQQGTPGEDGTRLSEEFGDPTPDRRTGDTDTTTPRERRGTGLEERGDGLGAAAKQLEDQFEARVERALGLDVTDADIRVRRVAGTDQIRPELVPGALDRLVGDRREFRGQFPDIQEERLERRQRTWADVFEDRQEAREALLDTASQLPDLQEERREQVAAATRDATRRGDLLELRTVQAARATEGPGIPLSQDEQRRLSLLQLRGAKGRDAEFEPDPATLTVAGREPGSDIILEEEGLGGTGALADLDRQLAAFGNFPTLGLSRQETPTGYVRRVDVLTPEERGGETELDAPVLDRLTRPGGFLEERGEGGFFVPTEEGLQERIQARTDLLGFSDEAANLFNAAVPGGGEGVGQGEQIARGLGAIPAGIANIPPGLILASETVAEAAQNAPTAAREFGAGRTALAAVGAVGAGVSGLGQTVEERPYQIAGEAAGGFGAGAAAGRAVGIGARAARARLRTVRGTEIDLADVTQEDVIRGLRTPEDPSVGTEFPSAADPALYRSRPAAAVRQQAEEMTPDVVQRRFEEAGVEEGVTLKKALDVEPTGPGTRTVGGGDGPLGRLLPEQRVTRAGGGLDVPEEVAGQYEAPGSFVGPELSPYFLRAGGGQASFSLRPGLPDFGDQPTGVFVRTAVEPSTADDLAGFADELVERTGDTAAVTKPAGSAAAGEIEAVLPPGARFADIGGSRTRAVARRAGIGADFYTEVPTPGRVLGREFSLPFTDQSVTVPGGTTRVPLRPVVPERDIDADVPTDADTGGVFDGLLGGGEARAFSARSYRELVGGRQAVDRPLPTFPVGPSAERPPPDRDADAPAAQQRAGDVDSDRRARRDRDTSPGGIWSAVFGEPTEPADVTPTDASTSPTPAEQLLSPVSPAGTSPDRSPAPASDPASAPPSAGGAAESGVPSGPPSDAPPSSGGGFGPPTDPATTPPFYGGGPPEEPPGRPSTRPRGGDEEDEDEDEVRPPLLGARSPYAFDFVDPLTGGVLETQLPGERGGG